VGTNLVSKGDLLTYDGNSYSRLPVGTEGQRLVVRPSAPNGIDWEDETLTPGTLPEWANRLVVTYLNTDPQWYWKNVYQAPTLVSGDGTPGTNYMNGVTPGALGATSCRVVQFTIQTTITVRAVRAFPILSGNAGEYQVGIYDAVTKDSLWRCTSWPAMTQYTWLKTTQNCPFTLNPGTYWFAVSSNGQTDDTFYFRAPLIRYNSFTAAGETVSPNVGLVLTLGFPTYGQITVVGGVLPDNLGTISARGWSATNIWGVFLDSDDS
jgi:hypothetical protein